MSFLNLFDDEPDLSEEDRTEYLGILQKLSQSTNHLLPDLLKLTSKTKYLNKYEGDKVELNQLITNSIDFYKSSTSSKSIQFDFKNEETHACIIGNPNMLQTIMNNLISNAIKFTIKGGNNYLNNLFKFRNRLII